MCKRTTLGRLTAPLRRSARFNHRTGSRPARGLGWGFSTQPRARPGSDVGSYPMSPWSACGKHRARNRCPDCLTRMYFSRSGSCEGWRIELLKRVSAVRICPGAHSVVLCRWRCAGAARGLARAKTAPCPLKPTAVVHVPARRVAISDGGGGPIRADEAVIAPSTDRQRGTRRGCQCVALPSESRRCGVGHHRGGVAGDHDRRRDRHHPHLVGTEVPDAREQSDQLGPVERFVDGDGPGDDSEQPEHVAGLRRTSSSPDRSRIARSHTAERSARDTSSRVSPRTQARASSPVSR